MDKLAVALALTSRACPFKFVLTSEREFEPAMEKLPDWKVTLSTDMLVDNSVVLLAELVDAKITSDPTLGICKASMVPAASVAQLLLFGACETSDQLLLISPVQYAVPGSGEPVTVST